MLRSAPRLAALCALAATAAASPLWDYVHKDDGAYSYYDTGITIRGERRGPRALAARGGEVSAPPCLNDSRHLRTQAATMRPTAGRVFC